MGYFLYLCSRKKEHVKHKSETSALPQHGQAGDYDKVHSYRRFSSNLIQELQEGSRLLCKEQSVTE